MLDLISLEWIAKEVGNTRKFFISTTFWPLQNCPWWPRACKPLLPCWAARYLPTEFWEKLQNQRGSGKGPVADQCWWAALVVTRVRTLDPSRNQWERDDGVTSTKSAKAYSLRNGPSNPYTFLDYEMPEQLSFLPSFTHATNSYYDTNELLLPSQPPYWIQPKPMIALITEGNKRLLKVLWIRWHWESNLYQTHGAEELLLRGTHIKPTEKYFQLPQHA